MKGDLGKSWPWIAGKWHEASQTHDGHSQGCQSCWACACAEVVEPLPPFCFELPTGWHDASKGQASSGEGAGRALAVSLPA